MWNASRGITTTEVLFGVKLALLTNTLNLLIHIPITFSVRRLFNVFQFMIYHDT